MKKLTIIIFVICNTLLLYDVFLVVKDYEKYRNAIIKLDSFNNFGKLPLDNSSRSSLREAKIIIHETANSLPDRYGAGLRGVVGALIFMFLNPLMIAWVLSARNEALHKALIDRCGNHKNHILPDKLSPRPTTPEKLPNG